MAVTQYIGARYVPKFYENSDGTAAWRSGVAYEPLTIVTYNGNSYTSKKVVPASVGNPSDNLTYWAPTGIYSEQVEVLRQEMLALRDDVETEFDEINTKIDSLDDRKVIFISDSYCDSRGGFTNGIYTVFLARSGFTDNTNAFLYHLGGAGFVGAGQNKTFEDLLDDAIAAGHTGVTDVIVAGGCNDREYTQAALNTAKSTFISKAHNAYPDATIHIAMCGGFINPNWHYALFNPVKYVYEYQPSSYVHIMKNAYLPMMIMSSYTNDGIHPSTAGCNWIGEEIARSFLGYPEGIEYASVTQTMNIGNIPLHMMIYGDHIQLSNTRDIGDTLDTAAELTYNQGGSFKIGSHGYGNMGIVGNGNGIGNDGCYFPIPVTLAAYQSSPARWILIPGELRGILQGDSATDWYFWCKTSPESVSFTQYRIMPFAVDIAMP